jgi:hypothetical protein
VADNIITQGVFQHYDKEKIAKLCEKHNLPSKALMLYTVRPNGGG